MENDNPPNETGGLKLVTVFIAVLALHVLVIGGISVYNLLKTPNLDEASLDYTRAQRPEPPAYAYETATPSVEEPAPLYQEQAPIFDTQPSAPVQTAQTAQEPVPTPSFDARLPIPPSQHDTSTESTPAVQTAAVPVIQDTPVPYTPSLSDGVPPGYAGMQDPFTEPQQAAPEQTLANTPSSSTTGGAYEQALAQQVTVASPSDAITHEVKPGETLGRIRALYGVSLAEIMAWNNIKDANRIRVGQKLVIQRTQTASVPAPNTSGSYATAPTAASKAAPKAQDKSTAVAKNKKKVIPSSVAVHRVSQGDTLYSIARKYDTTVDKIMAVNPELFSDPKRLRVGMRLSLPAHEVTAKKNKKPATQMGRASSTIPISTDIVMR